MPTAFCQLRTEPAVSWAGLPRVAMTVAGIALGSISLTACESTEVVSGPVLLVPIGFADYFCAEVAVTQGGVTESQSTCGRDIQPEVLSFACTSPATVAITLIPTSPAAIGNGVRNPCPAEAPCVQTAACRPDMDTTLGHQLTVIRDAEHGFFDIAVELGTPDMGRPTAHGEVSDFCVGLTVFNSAREVVWSQTGVCSSVHGEGTNLGFIGPCDASGEGTNEVEVSLEGATDLEGVALEGVRLPCGDGMTCTVAVTCILNTDVTVRFAP